MKRFVMLPALWCLLVSCSALPALYPVGDDELTELRRDCRYPYPVGRWQLLHTIEAAFPGGRKSLLMGVTVLSSVDRSLHSVLMTVEGLVLFDARFDKTLTVDRAIPPFDAEGFAAGLMQDIRLLFFAPEGASAEAGRLRGGAAACRYRLPDGGMLDMTAPGGRRFELHRYDAAGRLMRSVDAVCRPAGRSPLTGLPDRIVLRAHDSGNYALVLEQVEALRLGP